MCKCMNGCLAAAADQHVSVSSRHPSELGLSLSSSVRLEEVEEGSEPAEFVKAQGLKDKKAYDCMLDGTAQHALLSNYPGV